MNIKKKYVGFRKNIKKRCLLFCYNIRENHFFGMTYVDFRWIPCSFSACLRKLDYSWNRIQDNYNQDRYKGANKKCICWPILGIYNNWNIICFVDMIKHHKSFNTDINVNIKQNSISKISLNIGKYISDNDYIVISTIDRNVEN